MSWGELSEETRRWIEQEVGLTDLQLTAVKLLNAGYGLRKIAQSMGIDRSTARGHLAAAERKILKARAAKLAERDGS